ncbi:unnamed protein product, partial [Leptidea sinapis]
MEEEIKRLKSDLRCVVVSSPCQVDTRTLLRDYQSLVGAPLPFKKYGYREALTFLKERCSDLFVFQGPASNPVLTLIVPEHLQHIDKFVKSQKSTPNTKFKGKRRSITQSSNKLTPIPAEPDLIAKTFSLGQKKRVTDSRPSHSREAIKSSTSRAQVNGGCLPSHAADSQPSPSSEATNNSMSTAWASGGYLVSHSPDPLSSEAIRSSVNRAQVTGRYLPPHVDVETQSQHPLPKHTQSCRDNVNQPQTNETSEVSNRRRLPLTSAGTLESYHKNEPTPEKVSTASTSTPGREDRSSSRGSSSSEKRAQFATLLEDIRSIVEEHRDGVWCSEVLPLYKQRHGKELNFHRFGYNSLLSVVRLVEQLNV